MEIEIVRPKQFADKVRNYRLWADEHEVALIKPNSSQIVRLPEGTQTLRATIDWCSSPDFSVADIHGNKLVVQNGFASNILAALTLPLYYITFGRGKYLAIRNFHKT